MNGLPVDPAWLWLIGGVVLLIAELIAPGFSLIFIGAAAIATGVLSFAIGLGVALQLGTFAVLAVLAARFGGRPKRQELQKYQAEARRRNRSRNSAPRSRWLQRR